MLGKKESGASARSTKETILAAAFKKLSESGDFSFSLGEIAKSVGVSKAAIFRHYKNKDALFDAMKDSFFDDLALSLYECYRGGGRDGVIMTGTLLRAIIGFLAERQKYFGYLKNLCSTERDLGPLLARELKKRGITSLKEMRPQTDPVQVYAFTTIMYYVLQYRMCAEESRVGSGAFADSLMKFLLNGWQEIRELTENEKAAYNSLCVIDPDALPEKDRFFSALMAVIFKHGFLGITIERIADELGMAKSSLYAFFENKQMLLASVMQKEMAYFIAFLSEKLTGVTDVSCAVYMFLQLVYRYLRLRPEIIPIIVWHFAQGGKVTQLYENISPDDVGSGLRVIAGLKNAEFNVTLPDYSTAVWLASLPASMIIHRYTTGQGQLGDEEGAGMIETMYRQMGRPLQNEDECILDENFFTKE